MTQITKDKVKAWAEAAFIRAVRTFAQTAVAIIPVGISVSEVNWVMAGGVALLAALLSVLTSLAGLPEVNDGASLPSVAGQDNDA